jgi:predicted TIM-barrel fold metal-dependent hydrolase
MLEAPRRIDADVHCWPVLDALYPYMTAHWRDYVSEMTPWIFPAGAPAGVAYTYPASSPLSAHAADVTLDRLRTDVLERSSLAILNAYFGVETLRHPFLASALADAVNAWLQEEWLACDGRLLASLCVTPQDTDEAVAQINRAGGDARFVQVLLPARAWEPYGARRYWPIWRAAAERGLALGIHFGGLTGDAPTPVGRFGSYFEEYAGSSQLFAAHVMSLVASGIFEELPDLRVCVLESGVTWLPTLLWKLDTDWRAIRREIPWLRQPPSDYVRKHIRMTVEPLDAPDARTVVDVVDQLGSDELLMYASDFPHDHRSQTTELLAGLTREQRVRIDATNAWETYRLAERLAAPAANR